MNGRSGLPRVVGHRGAAAQAPENTLAAFARAAELGCSWIEFDVRLAADGVPVVLHDRSLARTAGLDAAIDDVPCRRLAALDAGSHAGPFWAKERIPTLAQALDACLVLGLVPVIEIKATAGDGWAAAIAVARLLRQRWPAGRPRPLVSSFSLRALYRLRLAERRMPLALTMGRRPRRFWRAHMHLLGCVSIHVPPALATPALVAWARRWRRKVAVFTVNDPAEARRLFAAGIDSIFSDDPERVAEAAVRMT